MKTLRQFLTKKKPLFQKGGKYAKLQSTFEAFEAFLYVPNKTTKCGTHIRDAIDLKRTMSVVVFALVPALLFGMFNVGYQHFLSLGGLTYSEITLPEILEMFWYGLLKVLPMIVVSYVVGLGIEFAVAQVRGHQVNEGFLVSGILIPMVMPIEAPLWMIAVSTAFAVIIGKEVFGGTGMNIWNPALVARAFFFFAYPSQISGDAVWIADKADAFSGATPLAEAAAGNIYKLPSVFDMFFGFIPGSIGETSTFAILIGAAILIFTGIGSWRIILSVFAGGMVMGLLLNFFAPASNLLRTILSIFVEYSVISPPITPLSASNLFMHVPAWHHLILGGFAFGAVFMATDPVSGTQTTKGKYIYGFLIGIFAILIRVLNPAYPEGMMLAILLMNTFAPLIDHYVVQGNIKRRLRRIKVLKVN